MNFFLLNLGVPKMLIVHLQQSYNVLTKKSALNK